MTHPHARAFARWTIDGSFEASTTVWPILLIGVGGLSVQLPDTVSYDIDATGGVGDVRNDLGSDPTSDRRVVVEGGVGSVSVSGS